MFTYLKRNLAIGAVLLFVLVAVYLNWSYGKKVEESAAAGRVLGEATLVNGETEGEEDDPLTLTLGENDGQSAAGSDYFATARLNRQQARDKALALLQASASDESAEASVREQAQKDIQALAAFTLSEAQIENLVTAKGYADCVTFLGEGSASVVVSNGGSGIADADVARIADIVRSETGLKAAQIKIIESN